MRPRSPGDAFRFDHERAGDASAAATDAGHHLGDLTSVGLVGRVVEEQRHGPDQLAILHRPQYHAPTFVGGCERLCPEGLGNLRRQRVHEADRASRGDGLDQEVGQRGDDLGAAAQCDDLKCGVHLSAPSDDDEVHTDRVRFVGDGGVRGRAKTQTVAGGELVPRVGFLDDQ